MGKEKGFRKQQQLRAGVESKMRIMWAHRAQGRHCGLVLCVCVMGRFLFNATEQGTSEILRTFCPEGWNFDKCSLLAKTFIQ